MKHKKSFFPTNFHQSHKASFQKVFLILPPNPREKQPTNQEKFTYNYTQNSILCVVKSKKIPINFPPRTTQKKKIEPNGEPSVIGSKFIVMLILVRFLHSLCIQFSPIWQQKRNIKKPEQTGKIPVLFFISNRLKQWTRKKRQKEQKCENKMQKKKVFPFFAIKCTNQPATTS